jgi:sugar O-acyltransferase (sialic acid O-acetyltransferase NeuD family)
VEKVNIILVGGGGHAKACLDVILSTNKYNVTGYLDVKESAELNKVIPYLGTDAELTKFVKTAQFLITVGQIESPTIRTKLYQQLKTVNAKFATVISAHAYVSPFAKVNEGSIIMHGVIVQFNANVGVNCIVNDNVLIEHDAKIGNHCHISTGAILNGEVVVKDNVFVGSGVVVRNGVVISENVVIGAGSNVVAHIEENCVVIGNPAKIQNNA